jgi:hypothetical protein
MSNNKYSVLLTLFDSQEDLISKEIKRFLDLEDFCNLDSSICNHERRRQILDCFDGQKFKGSRRIPLGDAFLLWARRRGILITNLSWKLESEVSSSLLLYLCEHQGWNLKALTIIDGNDQAITEDDLTCIVEYSSNLKKLNLRGCVYTTHLLIMKLKKQVPDVHIRYKIQNFHGGYDYETIDYHETHRLETTVLCNNILSATIMIIISAAIIAISISSAAIIEDLFSGFIINLILLILLCFVYLIYHNN